MAAVAAEPSVVPDRERPLHRAHAGAAAGPGGPFPGLRPYGYADHAMFFGREDQTYALYRLLNIGRFIAVVGSSGSGKSSLVRAGLLPLLDEESQGDGGRNWRWFEMRPGDAPLARLAGALAGRRPRDEGSPDAERYKGRRGRIEEMLRTSSFGLTEALADAATGEGNAVVLVVDQFEELFRFTPSDADQRQDRGADARRQAERRQLAARRRDEATHFVQLLLQASRNPAAAIYILITMRSDFIGECARFHGLPEAVCALQFLVPSLTRDQREEAIRGPIDTVGATIEPALVERLLVDSTEELDQLPVLQHCLSRLWIASEGAGGAAGPAGAAPASGRRLLEAPYHAIGEIGGALSKHADDVLASMPGRERAVEQIFRALTELDAEGRATRRALPFRQLAEETGIEPAELQDIARRLREEGFLVPSAAEVETLAPDDRIDIAHEALIRRWYKLWGTPTQPGWVDAEAQDGQKLKILLGLERLEKKDAERYGAWWKERRRTPAWAARYDADVAQVDELFRRSRVARRARMIAPVILIGTVIAIAGYGLYALKQFYEVKLNAATEEIRMAKLNIEWAKLEAKRTNRVIQTAEAEKLRATEEAARAKAATKLAETATIAAQTAVVAYVNGRGEAAGQRGPRPSDEAQQEVSDDLAKVSQATTQTAVADAATTGFLWIGSESTPKLIKADGTLVSPKSVQAGENYLTAANLVVRIGLPDAKYVSAPAIGTVATDTLIEALEPPVDYMRAEQQYWLHVRIKNSVEEMEWYEATAVRQLLDRQIDAAIVTMSAAYKAWDDFRSVSEVLNELKRRQPQLGASNDAAWKDLYSYLLADTLFLKNLQPPLVTALKAQVGPSAWCYQEEDRRTPQDGGPFSVHCIATADDCEKLRGPDKPPLWRKTACILTPLGGAPWKPKQGGFMSSSYDTGQKPFAQPFPQLE